MAVVSLTVDLPDDLWHAVQALASHECGTTTVALRALEEYVTAQKRRDRQRPGKYRKLVQTLSTPVADLHLSARPASALRMLNIRNVYEPIQKSPLDLFKLPNFGQKSLREVKEKLATLGLTLGMPLDDDSYRAAIAATVQRTSVPARDRDLGTGTDHRRVTRLLVPRRLRGGRGERHRVQVLDGTSRAQDMRRDLQAEAVRIPP